METSTLCSIAVFPSNMLCWVSLRILEAVGLKHRTPEGRLDWCQRTTSRWVRQSRSVFRVHRSHHVLSLSEVEMYITRCSSLSTNKYLTFHPLRASSVCHHRLRHVSCLKVKITTGCAPSMLLLIRVWVCVTVRFDPEALTSSWGYDSLWRHSQRDRGLGSKVHAVCPTVSPQYKTPLKATFNSEASVCVHILHKREALILSVCFTLQTSSCGCVCLSDLKLPLQLPQDCFETVSKTFKKPTDDKCTCNLCNT